MSRLVERSVRKSVTTIAVPVVAQTLSGALNLQDLKMTDQITGLENAGP